MKRAALALALACGCNASQPAGPPPVENAPPAPKVEELPGHGGVVQDNTHKEAPRLVPAEAYIRSYLQIFRGLAPLTLQQKLQAGGANLFDSWNAYLGALGLPDYAQDLPRATHTNAVMIAAFERLGVALCDKALEMDLKATPPVAVADRLVFAFDAPAAPVDAAAFAPRFDLLHRTFLAYPAKLAPTDREARFFKLYQDVIAKHDAKASRFTATEAGWAAVCYGLVRHPEFHLY